LDTIFFERRIVNSLVKMSTS